MIAEAIDFRYLLIENYKKLKLTENELVTIFVIDHLIGQGNNLITADLLALKMSLSSTELDKILTSLYKKKMIDYVTIKGNTVTTLDPLKELLYSDFQISLNKEKEQNSSKKIKDELSNIYKEFEELLSRQLSPVEISKIREWVSYGYSDEMIINALKDALSKGKKSLRSIDKILLSYQIRDDLQSDGMTTISHDWNKNLEETIKIAKTPWLDDKNGK